MKIRTKINSTHELKKILYAFLKRMECLEYKSRKNRILGKKINEKDENAILLLIEMNNLMELALADIDDIEINHLKETYLLQLNILKEKLNFAIDNSKILVKSVRPNLLKTHTILFNKLKQKQVSLIINTDIWINLCRIGVNTWNNNI